MYVSHFSLSQIPNAFGPYVIQSRWSVSYRFQVQYSRVNNPDSTRCPGIVQTPSARPGCSTDAVGMAALESSHFHFQRVLDLCFRCDFIPKTFFFSLRSRHFTLISLRKKTWCDWTRTRDLRLHGPGLNH
jgi:hypothetical protein